MSRLQVAKGSAEHSRKTDQRRVAAREAIRPAVGADQFALDAKCSRLKRDEINVLECGAVDRLAKHDCKSLR